MLKIESQEFGRAGVFFRVEGENLMCWLLSLLLAYFDNLIYSVIRY